MVYIKEVSATVTVTEMSYSPPRETAPLQRRDTFQSLQPGRTHIESAGNPSIGGRKMPGQSQIVGDALAVGWMPFVDTILIR
jgi:hypothetical protein